ncbi:MAG: hypothetical protein ABI768_00855 [Acidobacteriota bacterium]
MIGGAVLAAGCAGGYAVSVDSGPYARPYYPPPEVRYSFPAERFAALAHELDDRASRAHELAEANAAGNGPRAQEYFDRIHHFSDRARAFHVRYERGNLRDTAQLRGELQHLLDDAQATDAAIRQARVYAEVYQEWTGVIRVLNRMIQMVG